jgi:hypothetical protein
MARSRTDCPARNSEAWATLFYEGNLGTMQGLEAGFSFRKYVILRWSIYARLASLEEDNIVASIPKFFL